MNPIDEIKHFLVTRHVASGRTTVRAFGTDYEAAQIAYGAAERDAAAKHGIDVVLLSAESLETIKRTHSSYFKSGLLSELLPAY
jgi:hypothetical protein